MHGGFIILLLSNLIRNGKGAEALMMAVNEGHIEVVQKLLKRKDIENAIEILTETVLAKQITMIQAF